MIVILPHSPTLSFISFSILSFVAMRVDLFPKYSPQLLVKTKPLTTLYEVRDFAKKNLNNPFECSRGTGEHTQLFFIWWEKCKHVFFSYYCFFYFFSFSLLAFSPTVDSQCCCPTMVFCVIVCECFGFIYVYINSFINIQ